uniref:guanylate cyclase n=1 Tax=Oncorhynchus mykiss TaxID=8022 RepID=A0A8C7VA93_ONCMY
MISHIYGFINTCLKFLVIEKFGEETWEKLRSEVQDTFMTYEIYDDVITLRLVQEACTMLDMPSEVVLKLFREYFFSFCKMAGYDTMLRTLGGNLVEFIENLDALHSYLALSYQEMNAPSIRVEKNDDGRMLLHYYSDRKGLQCLAKVFGPLELCDLLMRTRCASLPHCPAGKRSRWDMVRSIVMFGKGERLRSFCHPPPPPPLESIRKFINSQFVLKTRREMVPLASQHQSMLKLRGQMVWMESLGCMVYLCSPKLRSLQELEERGLHISDIAQHDTTRDLILLNQQRLAEMELSNQLERKKEELRILSRHLEAEKKKTETLLYAMLPRHVANQLKEGKRVEAGEFQVCTILFSDVVTFTNICAACKPNQIVNMLNSMYSKFDRRTSVHDVYKVETIGDAYMVVGGVPIPADSHAEGVANFALGMRIAAREVTNPITGQPIQIRVGLHTGPVLAGVVGDKMPRYCLFGDTVNTASRMESHGVPDHIHLSPFTYRYALEDKRLMTTYFLLQNLCVSEDTILARGTGEPCVYRDNQQGAGESERGAAIWEVFLSHLDTEEPDSVRKEETNGQTMASASSSSDLTNEDTPFLGDTTPFQKGHLNDVNSRFCRLL